MIDAKPIKHKTSILALSGSIMIALAQVKVKTASFSNVNGMLTLS